MVDGINFDIQSPGVHAPLDLHTIVGKWQYYVEGCKIAAAGPSRGVDKCTQPCACREPLRARVVISRFRRSLRFHEETSQVGL